MCEVLDVVLEGELPEDADAEALDRAELMRALEEEDSFDEEGDSYEDEDDEEEEDSMDDSFQDDSDEEAFHGFGGGEEGVMDLDEGSSEDEDASHSESGASDESTGEEEIVSRTVPRKRKRGVASELDDGFFDLAAIYLK